MCVIGVECEAHISRRMSKCNIYKLLHEAKLPVQSLIQFPVCFGLNAAG